jgi:hypothetical protein
MTAKILFTTSKRIHPKFGELHIGKYTIEPMPGSSSPSKDVAATDRYLLHFDFTMDGDEGAQPFEEARLLLSYLALLLGTRFHIESEMLGPVQLPPTTRREHYPDFYGVVEELPDFGVLTERLSSLDADLARQYLRACEAYQTAVRLIEENSTLSFFLLTVSIECLSTKVITGTAKRESKGEMVEVPKGTCDKFVEFILTYLPSREDFSTEQEWREILKEVYYNHRSGFTHGGKKTPDAAILADMLNRKYVTNIVDGKEIKTPGLKWFESVVRRCLTGFLYHTEPKAQSEQANHFRELSLEYGRVILRAKKSLQKGLVVISEETFDLG